MGATFDGPRRRSVLCLLGLHRWRVRNAAGTVRFTACERCNLVDDEAARIIPPG